MRRQRGLKLWSRNWTVHACTGKWAWDLFFAYTEKKEIPCTAMSIFRECDFLSMCPPSLLSMCHQEHWCVRKHVVCQVSKSNAAYFFAKTDELRAEAEFWVIPYLNCLCDTATNFRFLILTVIFSKYFLGLDVFPSIFLNFLPMWCISLSSSFVWSVNLPRVHSVPISRSLMKMLRSIGPSIEPWGTPAVAYLQVAFVLPLCTEKNFKLSLKLDHLNLDK